MEYQSLWFSKTGRTKIMVQLCACRDLESISHYNLRSLVYIALEKMNVECNILDSMLITSFPFWADLVWNEAVGINLLSMHSTVAYLMKVLAWLILTLLSCWWTVVFLYQSVERSFVHQASAYTWVNLLILTSWYGNFWCWC